MGPLLAAWSITHHGMVLLGPGINLGLVFVFFDIISFDLDTGTFVNKMNHVDVSPHLCNVRLGGTFSITRWGITGRVGIPGTVGLALSREFVVTVAATNAIVGYNFAIVHILACEQALIKSGECSQLGSQAILVSCWIRASANWGRLNRLSLGLISIVSSPIVR